MLLTVAIVGFLNKSFIAVLPKLCFMHHCANPNSSSQVNGYQKSISAPNTSKYLFMIGLLARSLWNHTVQELYFPTEDYSGAILTFLLSASVLMGWSAKGGRKILRYGSWRNGSRILSCSIIAQSSGNCLANTYTIVSLWSQWRWVM